MSPFSLSLSLQSHYYEVADVFLQGSSKAEALRNLQSMPALDKNSCILRLLTSLGHDFSKEVTSKCFMPDVKDPKFKFIFDCLFMSFWSFVPWLEDLYKTGLTIPDGKTKRSIKGYIKTYLYRQFRMKVIGQSNSARAASTNEQNNLSRGDQNQLALTSASEALLAPN